MKRRALGLLLALGLGCSGPTTEDATGDAPWVVGPVFEGLHGMSVGETTSVRYFILHEDGSVDWGSTGFGCEPNEASAFGTWTLSAADEIEIRTSADSWPGNPNLELIRMRRSDACAVLEAYEVRTDGSFSGKGGHFYSRGWPCLSECDGLGEREIIECAGELDPCD